MKLINRDILIKLLDKYNINVTIDKIEKRYSESHRFYHTIEHINFLLTEIDKLTLPEKDNEILILSALFHDIIYIPGSKTNEKDSAELLLNNSEYSDDIQEIYDIIIDTFTHTPKTELSEIFCDIDMMSISHTTYDELKVGTDNVYKEFVQFFPHKQVIEGQVDFLKSILDTKYGKKNKKNILRLIKEISNDRGLLKSYESFILKI